MVPKHHILGELAVCKMQEKWLTVLREGPLDPVSEKMAQIIILLPAEYRTVFSGRTDASEERHDLTDTHTHTHTHTHTAQPTAH